jgi:hypothetical protein
MDQTKAGGYTFGDGDEQLRAEITRHLKRLHQAPRSADWRSAAPEIR